MKTRPRNHAAIVAGHPVCAFLVNAAPAGTVFAGILRNRVTANAAASVLDGVALSRTGLAGSGPGASLGASEQWSVSSFGAREGITNFPFRSLRFPGFSQPLTNLILGVCRKFRKPQAAGLIRGIHPSDLGGEFDLVHGIERNANRSWPPLSQGSREMESKSLLGGIQDDSASSRFKLDIGEFFRPPSWGTSAFRLHWRSKAPRY